MLKRNRKKITRRNAHPVAGPSQSAAPLASTSASSSVTKPIFDIKKIQEHLLKAYPYAKLVEGKEIVIVIGPTGVGKSTTVNYLLRHLMHLIRNADGIRVIETQDEASVIISHKIDPFTLYAQPVPSEFYPWIIVDCPGFQKTRIGIEDSVMESMSTELVIRNAASVKGIVILMDYNDIASSKAEKLQELMKTLMALFKDPFSMLTSSQIVITKIPRGVPMTEAKEDVIAYLERFKKHCQEKVAELAGDMNANSAIGLNSEDYEVLGNYLAAVLRVQENIILVDPLDQGESRTAIANAINRSQPPKRGLRATLTGMIGSRRRETGIDPQDNEKPITIDDFNFHNYDANRPKFNEAIYSFCHDAIELLDTIKAVSERISTSRANIQDAQNRLELEKKLKSVLEQPNIEVDAIPKQQAASIDIWKRNLDTNTGAIKTHTDAIKKLQEEQKSLTSELAKIDVATDHLYYQEELPEAKSSWYNVLTWHSKKFSATAPDGVTFSRIEESKKNGEWENRSGGEGESTYKVKYQSYRKPQPAYAQVRAYIQTRHEPGNATRIIMINNRLPEIKKEIESAQAAIAELEKDNKVFQRDIEEARAGSLANETTCQSKKQEAERQIKKFSATIEQSKSQIQQYMECGQDFMRDFQAAREHYDILLDIGKMLAFPSSLVSVFMEKYAAFLKSLPDFTEKALEQPLSSSSSPSLVIDPFGNPVREAVTIKGVIFDRVAITSHIATQKNQPFCFQHPQTKMIVSIPYQEFYQENFRVMSELDPLLQHGSPTSSSLAPQRLFTQSLTPELRARRLEELAIEETKITTELSNLQARLTQIGIERGRLTQSFSTVLRPPRDPRETIASSSPHAAEPNTGKR